MTGPRRLHNWCIEYIEDEDTESMILIFGLGGLTIGTVASFLVAAALWKIFKIPDLTCWIVAAIPAMFLSTVAIRVLYRKFRREQDEIFETLKKDYRA
jgi:uncharacterized protein YacL